MTRSVTATVDQDLAPGGVVSTRALRRAGWTRRDIRRAATAGDLERIRRGWYATAGAEPAVVRAVRAGGVLTCVSALRFHGVWVPDTADLHVGYSEFGDRRRRPRPGCRRCCPPGQRPAPVVAVDSPVAALAAAAGCLDAEQLVVVMDSLLHLRLLDRSDLHQALAARGRRTRELVDRCRRAEAGTETMVRERLRRRSRLTVRTQVQIGDIGRVDLLVGDRLVIEVDSVAHHTSLENYFSDRWRDLRLLSLGYVVIRLTYQQVVAGWEVVEPHVLHLLAHPGRSREPARRC